LRWLLPLLVLSLVVPGSTRAEDYAPETYRQHRAAQQTVSLGGHQLAYLDLGEGPPVLLVHGVPTSSWLYRKMVQDLVARGYRVVAPDLLGFGASEKPEDPGAYALGARAERLLALMDHLGIERWTHVCHDMGGLVSWELLERAPERVERLVVLNTFAFEEGWYPPADLARQDAMRAVFKAMTRRERRAMALTRVLVAEGLVDRSLCRDERVVEGYYRPIAEGAHRAMLDFLMSFEEVEASLPRYQATLAGLELPALLIWGEHDEILDAQQQASRLARQLEVPEDRQHLLAQGKHYIQEECAPEICELVDSLVRDSRPQD